MQETLALVLLHPNSENKPVFYHYYHRCHTPYTRLNPYTQAALQLPTTQTLHTYYFVLAQFLQALINQGLYGAVGFHQRFFVNF